MTIQSSSIPVRQLVFAFAAICIGTLNPLSRKLLAGPPSCVSQDPQFTSSDDSQFPSDEFLNEKLLEVGRSFGWGLLYEDPEEGLFIWRFIIRGARTEAGNAEPTWEARFIWYAKRVGDELAVKNNIVVVRSSDKDQAEPANRQVPFLYGEFARRWLALVGPVRLRKATESTHSNARYHAAIQQTLMQKDRPHVAGSGVMVISDDASITVNDVAVDTVPRGTVLTVRGFEGDRLKVRFRRPGAINYADVVSLDEAVERFSEAIRLNPNDAAAYSMRGNAWTFKGEISKGMADHDAAVRLDPFSASPYHRRGLALSLSGNKTAAIADFTRAHQRDPMDPFILYDRSVALAANGEHDKAIEDLDAALRRDPAFALALGLRGTVWLQLGEDEKALADLNEALRIDPDDAAGYFVRCQIWARRDDEQAMREDLLRAVRLDSTFLSYVPYE